MVSLFYQQVVLGIAFRITQLGPLAFCDSWLSGPLLFKVIKMSYWSLLSYLEMGTLIFDAPLYGIYWSFSLVYFFVLSAPCGFVPSTFLLKISICVLLVCKKCYCLFLIQVANSLGKSSLLLTVFLLKNAFVWKTWTWCPHLRQCAGQGGQVESARLLHPPSLTAEQGMEATLICRNVGTTSPLD